MNLVVSLNNIYHSFSQRNVLRGISLEIYENEMIVITGPNGSGKTTLLRILATLLHPSLGTVNYFYREKAVDKITFRKHMGVLFADDFLNQDLTIHENLIFYGRLHGIHNVQKVIDYWLDKFELLHSQDEMLGSLSRGERQRIGLIRSMLHSPRILIWDEPSLGLDRLSKKKLKDLMDDLRKGCSIIYSTHEEFYCEPKKVYQLNAGMIECNGA